jgi:uncharacterized membrane protein
MDDVVIEEGSEGLEVRLVECLGGELYLLGLETGRSPRAASTATGHEDVVAMLLPLAPNPVAGGITDSRRAGSTTSTRPSRRGSGASSRAASRRTTGRA